METLYLLIPVSVILVFIIGAIFYWAVHSGQYDDLEGPRHQLLMDDDVMTNEEKQDEEGKN